MVQLILTELTELTELIELTELTEVIVSMYQLKSVTYWLYQCIN